MENLIYNELVRRGYAVDVGVVDVCEIGEDGKRHQRNCEIDFVVNSGAKRYYIQSALDMNNKRKVRQELRPLLHTQDFFKKIVMIKTAMKPWMDEDGIVRLGLYDFLLQEDAIDF